MKQLKRKLRSNAGASMIFAMVFLMFCVFIGSSVLASASANAGRLEGRNEEQQAYLSQRSAALVMAEMLKGTEEAPMQMIIEEVTTTVGSAEDNSETVVTFRISGEEIVVSGNRVPIVRSNLQRIVFEHALKTAKSMLYTPSSDLSFRYENFSFPDVNEDSYYFVVNNEEWLYKQGQDQIFSLSLADGSEQLEDVDVSFSFPGYGIEIRFAEDSQLVLKMKGYISTGSSVSVVADNTTVTTKTMIVYWEDPVIEKEAAS